MLKRILAVWIVLSLLLTLTACDNHEEDAVFEAKDLTSDVQRQVPDIPDHATATDQATDNVLTDFAVTLFKAAHQSGENTLLSPLSVMYALGMTANGAGGETLAQMEQTLGMSIEDLNALLSYQLSVLSDEHATVHLADSVWFADNSGLNVSEEFLQTCVDYYDADIFKAAFDRTTLDDINAWVNEHTDGMIEQIVDNMPADAMMYLVNALAFDAQWTDAYEDTSVTDGVFTTESGEQQAAKMMHSTESYYLKTDNATGFLKHYKGGNYAFAALLPNEGVTVDALVDSLDGNALTALLSSPQSDTVYAALPQFENEFDIDLATVLTSLGMTDAFNPVKADFSAMGHCDLGLYISRVLHKTHIAVTQTGTKAGAATAVELRCGSALIEDPKTVTLDRPFVYMLVDCRTDSPLFIGTMMNLE